MLAVEKDIVVNAIGIIAVDKKIVIEDLNAGIKNFIENNKAVYLAKFYLCETRIASMIKRLVFSPGSMRSIDTDNAVAWVQKQLSIKLAEKQIKAVASSHQNKMMIITGGPGGYIRCSRLVSWNFFGIGGFCGMYLGARCQKYVSVHIIKLIGGASGSLSRALEELNSRNKLTVCVWRRDY